MSIEGDEDRPLPADRLINTARCCRYVLSIVRRVSASSGEFDIPSWGSSLEVRFAQASWTVIRDDGPPNIATPTTYPIVQPQTLGTHTALTRTLAVPNTYTLGVTSTFGPLESKEDAAHGFNIAVLMSKHRNRYIRLGREAETV
jgi:hypothetical protein